MSGVDKVIVADGDVLVRHALAEYLRDCGFRVVEAVDSDEVVKILNRTDLGVDIVLADARLGGAVGGLGLRQWVRDHSPDVEVVLGAGDVAQADTAANLCDQGPDLARPYDPQLVVDRIRKLRGRRDRARQPS